MLIALLLTCTTAATISGEIYAPKNPMDRKLWTPSLIKVQLDGEKATYLDISSSFSFHGISDGVHILEITHPVFGYRTTVLEVAGENVVARDANNFKGDRIIHPLRIQTEKKQGFFEVREGFSIWSILMNPMLLMSAVMLGVAFLSPKMKMDPEQMNEMKEMQKQMGSGWMSSLLNPPSN